MTDEEKKKLAAKVAAQGDAGGSSTNGRLSAPNTNSAMTGLRTGEDLEKGYSRHAVLEDGVPSGGGVGVSQTPVDGTQTIPQEIPDGSTVMTMGDGNKGVVTPQGQTLVPNAEEYQLPMTADGKVRPVLDMTGNSQVPANVGAPSVPQSPVVPMNTSGAIQPVQGNYAPIGTTPNAQGQSAPSGKGKYRRVGTEGMSEEAARNMDAVAAYLNGEIGAKDLLVMTGQYPYNQVNDKPDDYFDAAAKEYADEFTLRGYVTYEPTDNQIENTEKQSNELRGRTPIDNTKGANTEGEYWRVAPKEEVKAQPSQTEKQERVIPDYMQSEDSQRGLNESLAKGSRTPNTLAAQAQERQILQESGKGAVMDAIQREFGNGNVDVISRPLIDSSELVKKGWKDAGNDGYATVYSSQYGIVDSNGNVRELLVTPILPDGRVLSQSELEDYLHNTLEGSDDILKADNLGIVIGVDVDQNGSAGERLHQLQEQLYDLPQEKTSQIRGLYGGNSDTEGTTDRAKRLDNALLSDYDDSSLLLQEYAKGLISPEEEERRARRARAAEGWAHIGNIISGFAGLANTKKGSPNIDLADVKDAKVDEWRDKVRNNRLAYQKARLQMDREKSAEYWRAQKFEETKRKNDADIERIKANIRKAQSEADYKAAMTELQNKRIELEEEKVELTKARTKAVIDGNARQERYYDERLKLIDEQIRATEALARQRNENANRIANGGSSGSGTSKPVVVGGKEVANPRKLNQGDVNRHIKAVAKNNGIEMTKRGSGGLDEKDKTIDELGEEIAGNPKALQELRDRLANGESGGSTNGTKKALPGANKPASGKKKLPGK
jgi:hypothetical protein